MSKHFEDIVLHDSCHLSKLTLSNLRRTAWSKPYGMLVAPSTSTRASELVTPCICTRNSVLMRLAASLSPSPLVLHSASICTQEVQQSEASSNACPMCTEIAHITHWYSS